MFSFDQRSPCGEKEEMQSAQKRSFSQMPKSFIQWQMKQVLKFSLRMHLASARKPVLVLEIKKEAMKNE